MRSTGDCSVRNCEAPRQRYFNPKFLGRILGVRCGPSPRPWPNASMPSTPGVCVKFYDTIHQAYKWDSSEHHRLFAGLWKGKMLSAEVLRSPGSVIPGERPSPCRLRRTATAIWLEETRGASKNHLAENDRRWCSAPELWSPHGVEESKRQGGLASSRQYGNALLEVCYQEEEHIL